MLRFLRRLRQMPYIESASKKQHTKKQLGINKAKFEILMRKWRKNLEM